MTENEQDAPAKKPRTGAKSTETATAAARPPATPQTRPPFFESPSTLPAMENEPEKAGVHKPGQAPPPKSPFFSLATLEVLDE